ncbi:MAG: prepilin-type N-terminal cleavage/methylation domain-containing protein [Phycisphaerales bacterium]|nr:prepilin-type N-terminal cleavage/methylation domain-containing protein [Phycisphaerales bacterium]
MRARAVRSGTSGTGVRENQVTIVRSHGRAAFSLIELLVAIAIIAALLAITLPALARSRESARQAICLSNVRQVMLAFTTYAGDYRGVIPGTYWQGAQNLDWCGRNNVLYTSSPGSYRHPFETSVMRDHLDNADRVLGCPTAKRHANTFFDYTAVIRMAGARIDLPWHASYPLRPQVSNSPRKPFPHIPLLVEEHDLFYNRTYDDGSFAGNDQVSTRHGTRASGSDAGGRGGAGHIGYLDGSVGAFRPPVGPSDRLAENSDLDAGHFRLLKKRAAAYPVWESSATEFGWANRAAN